MKIAYLLAASASIALASCSSAALEKVANADDAVTVHYEVTSDGSTVSITETALIKGTVAQNQQNDAAAPVSKDVEISGMGKNVSVMAQAKDGNEITCTMTVDGKEVARQTSSGQYSVATCSYAP